MSDVRVDWVRTVDPTSEPLTLAELKQHCRGLVDTTDEDALITLYGTAAREVGELFTGRGWLTQTWKMTASDWADVFWLPMAAPLVSVSSVKYYDSDGVQQTLSSSYYIVDTVSEPGRVTLAPTFTWPSLQASRLSSRVEIVYVVGWASAALVPYRFKAGMALMADHLYENRSVVQVGIGVGAVEVPHAVATFWGDPVRWREPECAWSY